MGTEDHDKWWEGILTRDPRLDGVFVYAVASTGIYCRPSCPSKRPRRNQVSFFGLPEAAERAGYRPCLRCKPDRSDLLDPNAKLVRQACRLIEKQDPDESMTLRVLAARLRLSTFHLQRTFKRFMGITPRQYGDAVRLSRLKALVKEGQDVTSALYEAGYGSSSRLYEKADSRLGMTPGAYLKGGRGMKIAYTLSDSPLGRMLVAATEKGVCSISLGTSEAELEISLFSEFPEAEIHRDDDGAREWVEALLEHLKGWQPHCDLPVDVRVTAFQEKVYDALRAIPYGSTRTYEEVAADLGHPNAARAVGRACAANRLALVVPCHRVVRKDGGLGGYRWGLSRKKELLEKEKRVAEHLADTAHLAETAEKSAEENK